MAETLTIRTSSSTDVIKVVERGPQGPAGPAGSGVGTLTVQGDMLYRDNAGAQRLPIGTSGQVLKVSSGGLPEWGATSAVDLSSPGPIGATTPSTADFTVVAATEAASSNPTSVSSTLGIRIKTPTAGGQSAVGMYGVVSGGSPQARIYGAGTSGTLTNIATFDSTGMTVATGSLKLTDATGGETATFDASGLSSNRTFNLTDATGRLPAFQSLDSSGTPYPFSPGVPGQLVFASAGYLYFCAEPNRWRRVQMSEGSRLINTLKSVTGSALDDVFTSNAHGFVTGQRIRFTSLNGGISSVGGISVNTLYFVRNHTANTFQLAATGGISAPLIDLTATLGANTFFTQNDWV